MISVATVPKAGANAASANRLSELSMPTTSPLRPSKTKPIIRMRKRNTALIGRGGVEAEAHERDDPGRDDDQHHGQPRRGPRR